MVWRAGRSHHLTSKESAASVGAKSQPLWALTLWDKGYSRTACQPSAQPPLAFLPPCLLQKIPSSRTWRGFLRPCTGPVLSHDYPTPHQLSLLVKDSHFSYFGCRWMTEEFCEITEKPQQNPSPFFSNMHKKLSWVHLYLKPRCLKDVSSLYFRVHLWNCSALIISLL